SFVVPSASRPYQWCPTHYGLSPLTFERQDAPNIAPQVWPQPWGWMAALIDPVIGTFLRLRW
ncbi:MAG TPA: hypothetical protein VK731_06520, partial [Candidatus Cybelea sp.]|nr:hypothetical protein [Candidatus Cybelea sp.]